MRNTRDLLSRRQDGLCAASRSEGASTRSRKVRATFVTSTYPRYESDHVPGFVADLAEHLVSDHDMDVLVVAPHEKGLRKRDSLRGVRIQRFQYSLDATKQCVAYGYGIPDNLRRHHRAKWQLPGFFASMGWTVLRMLGRSDIVHAHWIEPGFVALLANRIHRRPVVITVHRFDPTPRTMGLYRWTLERADRVLFNSRFTMEEAAKLGFRCRGQVVYQGYDQRLFGAQDPAGAVRASLGIPRDAVVVATVGRMVPFKGMLYLARAATQILEGRPSVHLVMAGSGPTQDEVVEEARRSPVASRIHCPGALGRNEVSDLLADADVFVIPSVIDSYGRTETLGVTALEAMACGLPCVGSRVGGIVETIVDKKTGLLVEPADVRGLAQAVNRLLDDRCLRQSMGSAGRERAQRHFTWSCLAAEVADVYAEILGRRDGKS